tara:strand:- start:1364 stop:1537 length:174 start_codon:yes stop_codon:yes gene_type:complete
MKNETIIKELESIIKQLKGLMEHTTSDLQENSDRQLLRVCLSYLLKALRTYSKRRQE